jgi:hypothetical protein
MKSLDKCAQHVHHKGMSHQQKRSLLRETGGGAQSRVLLGPVVGILMSLLKNGVGHLGYPTASGPTLFQ